VRVPEGRDITLFNKALVSEQGTQFQSLSGVLAAPARFGARKVRDCDGSAGEQLQLHGVAIRRLDWLHDGHFRAYVESYEKTGGAPCGWRTNSVILRVLARLLP